jgi:phytoene dehydrogenase-like protein
VQAGISNASYDAVIIGSGPNGLAAAIAIAETGRRAIVFEAAETIGGGCRSAQLTLPGFVHDICSAVHPLATTSRAFRALPLASRGLEWIHPPALIAHPFDDGSALSIVRSLDETVERIGGADGNRYRRLMAPLIDAWPAIQDDALGPLCWPRHPLRLARFGVRALQSASSLVRPFRGERVRAAFAGIAAHSMLPLDTRPTGGVALVLAAIAHVAGWPFPRGGAQCLADALAAQARVLGTEIVTGTPVRSLHDLPSARAILCDLSPRPLLTLAGDRFPSGYRRALTKYRYGMGVYKVDWALDGPIPWRNPECARSGTVHLGGSFGDIAASEHEVWHGRAAERPFVILTQPTLFDDSRAPEGRHVAWTYCHVPNGSTVDMLPRIERQIERFAPGFRDRVMARAVMRPADFERHNPNLVGGDIAGGAGDLWQMFTRPTWRTYSTPVRGLYICSASTPPGIGVHGLCGYFAAHRALREVLRD